jgi:acylphosphatase
MATRRIFVSGKVQGVFYRNWTVETAKALGIAGWVRNREDGRVEIQAEGSEAAIDALIAACRGGPPAAQVDSLESLDAEAEQGADFVKRPTV